MRRFGKPLQAVSLAALGMALGATLVLSMA